MTTTTAAIGPPLHVGAAPVRFPYRFRITRVPVRVADGGAGADGPAPRTKRRRTSSEALLHAAWRRAAKLGVQLHTRGGDAYRVLYSGRPADGPGPDFRDAVLVGSDGTRIRGDIEIHVRASGWSAHGHNRDARYNGVVFHVTLGLDAPGETLTASGLRIPLLALGPVLRASRGSRRAPARARCPGVLPDITLAEAGDRRFLARSAGFMLEMRRAGVDQTLYAGVMECLGYSRNRSGFRQLAARLSWPQLATVAASAGAAFEDLAAALLWAGGLGGRPRHVPALSGRPPRWAAVHGRPDNAPQRRIMGAAALAGRLFRAGGPLEALAAMVSGAGSAKDVVEALTVGPPSGETRALIGSGRAAEISVNAVIPGLHAWAVLTGSGALEERCLELYRGHPKTPENALTREALRLLTSEGRRPRIRGAREQQGLIYLYRALSPLVA